VTATRHTSEGTGWYRAAVVLVLVASVCAFVAIPAVWVNRQLLDTDAWTETSTEMIEDPVIRDGIAAFMADKVVERLGDARSRLGDALPIPLPEGDGEGLKAPVENAAQDLLTQPEVQSLWVQANREAHEVFVADVENSGSVVGSEGGEVVLRLGPVLEQLTAGRAGGAIPPGAAEITVVRSERLAEMESLLRTLERLPIVLIVLTLGLFGAALALAPERRRSLILIFGIGLIVAGAAALIARSIAGGSVLGRLDVPEDGRPAADAAWGIATSLFAGTALAVVAYGVVLAAGAWLAGSAPRAVAIRRAAAPYARHAAVAFGGVAVIAVLLFLLGPSPVLVLLLVVLLAVATELLRRQILREHPEGRR
jgi:hypothetical protein